MSTPTKEEIEYAVTELKTARHSPYYNDIRTVLAALETAQKDSERVDKLEKLARNESGNCDHCTKGQWKITIEDGTDYYECGRKLSLREAIDSARTP